MSCSFFISAAQHYSHFNRTEELSSSELLRAPDPGGGQCDIVVEGGLPVAFYKTPPDVDKTRIDVTPD